MGWRWEGLTVSHTAIRNLAKQHVPSRHFTEWNPKKRGNNNNNLATLPNVDAIEHQTNQSSENPLGQYPSSAHSNRAGYTGCDNLYMYWANATDLFKRPLYWFLYCTYLSYFSSLPSVTSADLLTSSMSKHTQRHKAKKGGQTGCTTLWIHWNQVCVALIRLVSNTKTAFGMTLWFTTKISFTPSQWLSLILIHFFLLFYLKWSTITIQIFISVIKK